MRPRLFTREPKGTLTRSENGPFPRPDTSSARSFNLGSTIRSALGHLLDPAYLMGAVALLVADPDPVPLVAVTVARSRDLVSASVTTYVRDVAPEMLEHDESEGVVQRSH